MSVHHSAVVGNLTATAAAVISASSLVGAPTNLAEWVGTIAGAMSIIYWTVQFVKWVNNHRR